MFDYQVSKHPHFDEACRAFALRHNPAMASAVDTVTGLGASFGLL